MKVKSVAIREFRAHTADYLGGHEPIAVTKHGRTIGLYFPLPPDEDETTRAFARLADAIDRIRQQEGLSEQELSDWFNLRRPARA